MSPFAKWRALVLAAALALSASAALAQTKTRSLIGTWGGSYVCGQGKTGLTLSIDKQQGENFSGYFHFYPPPGNSQARQGCFSVRGRIAQGHVAIKAKRWITRPPAYVTVDLDGELSDGDQSISGDVIAPFELLTRCQSFALSLQDPSPQIAGLCRHAELQALAGR